MVLLSFGNDCGLTVVDVLFVVESGMFTLKVMFLTEQSSGGLHFVATEGNDVSSRES